MTAPPHPIDPLTLQSSMTVPTHPSSGTAHRAYWLKSLVQIADPVLLPLAQGRLKEVMPVATAPEVADDRTKYTHLEAFGRLMAGIAPWLAVDLPAGSETEIQRKLRSLAQASLDRATDPTSPDYLNFGSGQQSLVDTAFLAQALLRAPRPLFTDLPSQAQGQVVAALQASRKIRPFYNNWLLFSATVEAALCRLGQPWDEMRVDYAVRQLENWYQGDGVYGDGPEFHFDYYNSFVIFPMLLDILRAVSEAAPGFEGFYVTRSAPSWSELFHRVLGRAKRYAQIQERLIMPDGSFPPLGRSLAYRFGAFQSLSQMALIHELPPSLPPAQVRCALTAVLHRVLDAPGTFDDRGFLTIGLCGYQPAMGEPYISTGSLYLCAAGLLALGLPPSDEFWQAPGQAFTAQRVWSGQNVPADHAL